MESDQLSNTTLFPQISGPLSEDYPQQLIDLWQERFPELDVSAVPLFSLLRISAKLLENFHEKVLKPFGVTLAEYLIIGALRTLGAGATMTPKDLNKVLMQTSAGITKTLTRLEKAGFVQRKPNPQDKRSILIELTPDGFEITDQISRAEAKAQRKKSALLSAGDIDKIIDVQRLVITMLAD